MKAAWRPEFPTPPRAGAVGRGEGRSGRSSPQRCSRTDPTGPAPRAPRLHSARQLPLRFLILTRFFSRTVHSPIYTFSIWPPFLITSFSLGEEKAEVFEFRAAFWAPRKERSAAVCCERQAGRLLQSTPVSDRLFGKHHCRNGFLGHWEISGSPSERSRAPSLPKAAWPWLGWAFWTAVQSGLRSCGTRWLQQTNGRQRAGCGWQRCSALGQRHRRRAGSSELSLSSRCSHSQPFPHARSQLVPQPLCNLSSLVEGIYLQEDASHFFQFAAPSSHCESERREGR